MTAALTTLDEKILRDLEGGTGASGTQEYFVNMGPQHPSSHGVLRLLLRLDGETVREVTPVLGYIHRGIEKMAEGMKPRQIVHLSDRLDYLSALHNNWAVSLVLEKAAGIQLNERIEAIRTIMAELQRIASHQLWWGVFGMDLGAFTPFLYGFRDREEITDIFEETMGGRLTMNYIQPGGVMYDIHPNFAARVKKFLAAFRPKLDEYEELLTGNVILGQRLKEIGILDRETALGLGTTGPVLRGSGVPLDLRKSQPYGAYGQVEFAVPVGTVGDCWDRYWVRVAEMRQSMRILEQLIDSVPEGKHSVMKPLVKIKMPAGIYFSQVETPRGILGCLLCSDGGETPRRFHFRSPCFNNLWAITRTAPGWRVADIVAILSSLDLVIPDMDR